MSLSIQTQEAQIRQVQTLAFEGIGGNSWASGDDSTIRADLENLHKRLKAWAKKHAVEDMCELKELAAEERDSLITLLARVVRPHSGAQNVIEALESAPLNKKPLAMCLQGLLSRHAYTNIINRPFFVLEDAGETLHSVYHQIHQGKTLRTTGPKLPDTNVYKVNGNESHIWRSKTLRLLAASPPNAQLEGGLSNYSATQKDVCSTFANDFYNGPAQYLIKPSSRKGGDVGSQCFNELEAIVQYAGELSYRLWSRRTTLRVLSLPDLKDQPFTARSEYLKAHPLHRLYEDDDRCDGWFVSVVAHPAVLGFGSTDGKDYSTPRVWMKAEVWLTEDI
ncbi:hypothetical protein C8A00DRAFT_16488 [Chaetomidium leptoderma]|uniref:Uncharacterized protein n=1 Tax=Chaetomidium leptoderma TaxID=669021 RepID=A0AAN6ZX84_9PEZI|nr:hypothetical protein C8A00DRAFT_16488 [Chaetomidium leptoderma]